MLEATNRSIYLILLLAGIMLISCKPEYPNCETDAHCQTDQNLGDVCVNGSCQECFEDAQCQDDNHYCNNGRCDPRIEGVNNCSANSDCTEGRICQNNQCVEGSAKKSCFSDGECGSDSACIEGFCKHGAESALQAAVRQCQEIVGADSKPISVQFNFNDSELTTASQQSLKKTADCLQRIPAIKLRVEGHCDDRGTQEYNLALGEQRAFTVIQYLRNLGVSPVRLAIGTKGENVPKCIRMTEECHAQNRRVELEQLRN